MNTIYGVGFWWSLGKYFGHFENFNELSRCDAIGKGSYFEACL